MKSTGLTPTRITDRNGRATTVYRRTGAASTASAAPAAARPALTAPAAAGPRDHETMVLDVQAPGRWWTEQLHRMDPYAPLPTAGTVALSYADAYRYLSLGLGLEEAGQLHASVPEPGHWEALPGAASYGRRRLDLIQSGGRNGEGIAEAVAHMRAAGTSPRHVEQMVGNGFSDSHIRGALDADQLKAVFVRVKYERATAAGRRTRSADMLDRLIDGSLPHEVIERGCRKGVLCNAADFLFDPTARAKAGGADEDAQSILRDREGLLAAIAVMDAHARAQRGGVSLKAAWQACRMFSEDFASTHPLGATVPRDLTVEGCAAVSAAIAKGYPVEQAAALLQDDSLTTEQAVAAITGTALPTVADGWL